MKFLTTFFEKFKREPDLIHPVFGELTSDCDGSDDGFWQLNSSVSIHGNDVYISIVAGFDGPSDKQVTFFNLFKENLSSEIDLVKPFLLERYESWEEGSISDTFESIFSVEGLTIPKNGDRNNDWSVSFGCRDDESHLYTVHFKNGKPDWCAADG